MEKKVEEYMSTPRSYALKLTKKNPTHVVKKIPPNMISASFVLEKHKLL